MQFFCFRASSMMNRLSNRFPSDEGVVKPQSDFYNRGNLSEGGHTRDL